MWKIYLLGLTVGLGAVAAPGPINVEIVRRSLAYGARIGGAFGLGVFAADLCFLVATSMGAAAIINGLPPWARAAIFGVGAILLLAFGLKALRFRLEDEVALAQKELQAAEASAPAAGRGVPASFFLGLALTLSTPTTYACWLGVGLAAASHGMEERMTITLPLAAGFATTCLIWLFSVVHIAGSFHRVVRPRTQLVLDRVVGGVLCAFAAYSAYLAVRLLLH